MSRSETRAWPTPPSAATPRPCLAARRGPILEDTRPQPFADEADDASVADAVFHESDEPILTDRIERSLDRLPITKTFRSRPSSHVSGIPLKDADFLSSGA